MQEVSEAEARNNTFSPALSEHAKVLSSFVRDAGQAWHERLYTNQQGLSVTSQQMASECQASCSFSPALTAKARSLRRPGDTWSRLNRCQGVSASPVSGGTASSPGTETTAAGSASASPCASAAVSPDRRLSNEQRCFSPLSARSARVPKLTPGTSALTTALLTGALWSDGGEPLSSSSVGPGTLRSSSPSPRSCLEATASSRSVSLASQGASPALRIGVQTVRAPPHILDVLSGVSASRTPAAWEARVEEELRYASEAYPDEFPQCDGAEIQ